MKGNKCPTFTDLYQWCTQERMVLELVMVPLTKTNKVLLCNWCVCVCRFTGGYMCTVSNWRQDWCLICNPMGIETDLLCCTAWFRCFCVSIVSYNSRNCNKCIVHWHCCVLNHTQQEFIQGHIQVYAIQYTGCIETRLFPRHGKILPCFYIIYSRTSPVQSNISTHVAVFTDLWLQYSYFLFTDVISVGYQMER